MFKIWTINFKQRKRDHKVKTRLFELKSKNPHFLNNQYPIWKAFINKQDFSTNLWFDTVINLYNKTILVCVSVIVNTASMLFEKHVLNWIQIIWQLETWHYIFQHNTARFVLHYENVAVRLLTRLIHGLSPKYQILCFVISCQV